MALQFKKAVKSKAKGRIALIGVSGGGKSYTALTAARALVGPTGKIAAVDTEHGSLSKYAHTPQCGGDGVCEDPSHFEFDVIELDDYTPDNFQACMKAARDGGYDALIIDSLSHFWVGKGGALEFVDLAAKKSSSRDGMSGWKEFRPHERAMVDDMIAAPFHVIVTMRSKTDYQEVERNGKKSRVKVGLAPVQREGMEYEFDLVGMMNDENDLIIDKSRCFAMSGKVYPKPDAKVFAVFAEWLGAGADRPAAPPPQPAQTKPAASAVAQTNGNGHQAAPTPDLNHHIERNLLRWPVTASQVKHTSKSKPYLNLIFDAPPFPGKGVVCWHGSLFDLLQKEAPGKVCQFEFTAGDKFVAIDTVLAIGSQEYRDGKPYVENLDSEPQDPDEPTEPPSVPPMSGATQQDLLPGTPISDSDLPASMFDEPATVGVK
jgi:hypothetical protein